MNKYLTLKDIQQLIEKKEDKLIISQTTKITNAAKDLLEESDIKIVYDNENKIPANINDLSKIKPEELHNLLIQIFGVNFFQQMMGLALPNSSFQTLMDANGTKIIKANSIPFIKKNFDFQEQKVIDNECFEISYVKFLSASLKKYEFSGHRIMNVLSNAVTIITANQIFQAEAGDCIHIPEKATVTIKSHEALLLSIKLKKI